MTMMSQYRGWCIHDSNVIARGLVYYITPLSQYRGLVQRAGTDMILMPQPRKLVYYMNAMSQYRWLVYTLL